MSKYITLTAFFAIATAAPGFIVQPVEAKVDTVIHTGPPATSHQSITQVHNNAHIVTPVVKTLAPVFHAAPVVPVPALKSFSTPVVHHVPVVKSVIAPIVPVVHAVPVVKSVVAAPVAHFVHH